MILKLILISSIFIFSGCSSHSNVCDGILIKNKCASAEFISGTIISKHRTKENSFKYIVLDSSGKSIIHETKINYNLNQKVNIRYELK